MLYHGCMNKNAAISSRDRDDILLTLEQVRYRMEIFLDCLSSDTATDEEKKRALKSSFELIKSAREMLDRTQRLLVDAGLSSRILSTRQIAQALGVSASTISRQSGDPVQAPLITSGTHLTDTEMARVVARFYGWTLEDGVRFVTQNGKKVGNDMAQAAYAMRELGWFFNPSKPSIGIRWPIMPNCDAEGSEKAAGLVCSKLKGGMYWYYDNDNNPVLRVRDNKTYSQVEQELQVRANK